MSIISKQLEKELEVQCDLLDEPEKLRVITRLIHPLTQWSWYLICFKHPYDKSSIYCLLDGIDTEFGWIPTYEINRHKILDLPFEIDEDFEATNAHDLYKELKNRIKI